MTLQLEYSPHVPSQGFEHFWLIQAKCTGHSELTTHSGRQFGGAPTKFGKQEHTAWRLTSLH